MDCSTLKDFVISHLCNFWHSAIIYAWYSLHCLFCFPLNNINVTPNSCTFCIGLSVCFWNLFETVCCCLVNEISVIKSHFKKKIASLWPYFAVNNTYMRHMLSHISFTLILLKRMRSRVTVQVSRACPGCVVCVSMSGLIPDPRGEVQGVMGGWGGRDELSRACGDSPFSQSGSARRIT